MPGPLLYDDIGRDYARYRRPDPRIASMIREAVRGAVRVVNVGAGTGSYEPSGPGVVAVEPSRAMTKQRASGAAWVQAVAERLPFADRSFDVALALLTVHHWPDARAGFAEMRRVAGRQVVLTWDPSVFARFWLVRDYVPEVIAHEAHVATLDVVRNGLGRTSVRTVPVPWDCSDGFLAAYWRCPERYLDAGARGATSGLALLEPPVVERAMARLASDLADGTWDRRYGHLRELSEFDAGYRLVVSTG